MESLRTLIDKVILTPDDTAPDLPVCFQVKTQNSGHNPSPELSCCLFYSRLNFFLKFSDCAPKEWDPSATRTRSD